MKGIILSAKEDVKEIKQLAGSLGYEIVKEFVQKKDKTTPYYLGKGKIEEVKNFIEENGVEFVIVNDSLRPSQWYNLEKLLNVPVYDRIRIILEIFADRAKKKEAKLQVKLAKLRYEKPFVRELFHRVKKGEKAGFLGGGEYVVADYYEMIKRQMKRIKEELKKIAKEREIKRVERRERGFYIVSIAGYTNAGKSCLLNYLTGEKVVVEEKVFSTLSPKVSRYRKNSVVPLLFTDTVGFIKDLPHWLIDAFHSTLEEIALADLVIVLIDANDNIKEMKEKAMTSIKEIKSLKENPRIIIALNKIDLLSENDQKKKKEIMEKFLVRKCIPISAKTGKNIDLLLDEIYNNLPKPANIEITLPNYEESFISWLHKNAEISHYHFNGVIRIKLKCSERLRDKIVGKCKKLGGRVRIYGD